MWIWWVVGILAVAFAVVLVVLVFFRKSMGRFAAAIQFERARELFKLQRERLHERFFEAGAASGKPRGLRWEACEWEQGVEYARDRHTGQIIAFVSVTLHFEAIEGGEMENVAAVKLPRNATAVFYFTEGQWHTNGTTIMNQNPDEAVERFQHQYDRLGKVDE